MSEETGQETSIKVYADGRNYYVGKLVTIRYRLNGEPTKIHTITGVIKSWSEDLLIVEKRETVHIALMYDTGTPLCEVNEIAILPQMNPIAEEKKQESGKTEDKEE